MSQTSVTAASPSAVQGLWRVARGGLTATFATATAAVSHSAAGHHSPHWIVVGLALAIAWPVCVQLSSSPLSRMRLGGAVLTSQAVFHGLFALFPATQSAAMTGSGDHGMHGHAATVPEIGQADGAVHVLPDASMLLGHLLAAALTYAVIRRGELNLHALSLVLFLRPALLLAFQSLSPGAPRAIDAHGSFTTAALRDVWLGERTPTLRGPPILAN